MLLPKIIRPGFVHIDVEYYSIPKEEPGGTI